MQITNIIGYFGAILIVTFFILRIILSFILQKRIPGIIDMFIWLISMLMLLIYAIINKYIPFIIFFLAAITWDIIWLLQKKY